MQSTETNREGRKRFAAFLAALDEAVSNKGDIIPATVSYVEALVRDIVSRDDWLDPQFAKPHPEYYQQYLLYCDPQRRFSVVSFVWGPGQETPIHDHTVWGCVGMLRGQEICQEYEISGNRLIPQAEQRLEPGQTVSFGPERGDVHRVRNAYDDRVSVSIHVYGDDIGAVKRHVYQPDGSVKSFISGYSNHVLPNYWGTN